MFGMIGRCGAAWLAAAILVTAGGGIGALPAALAQETTALPSPPPLDAYGNLPEFEDAALSPSGDLIAALLTSQGRRYVVAMQPDMSVVGVLPVDDAKVRSVGWAGEDRMVVTLTSTEDLGFGFTTDQAEFTRAVVVPLGKGAGEPQVVFANQRNLGNFTRGSFGTRLVNGRWKMFYGALTFKRGFGGSMMDYQFDHNRPSLYAVDAQTLENERIDPSPPEGSYRDWLIDASGDVVARLDMASSSGSWKLTNADGKALATGKEPYGNVWLVTIGYDGDTAIYSVEDNGVDRWMEVPLDGSAGAREIMSDEEIDRLYYDYSSGQLIGYLRSGVEPQPVFRDPRRQQIAEKIRRAFAGKRPRMVDWTADMGRVLVRIDGGQDSGSWFLVDIATMSASAIGYERSQIPPAFVGKASEFDYTARDGLEMDGILTLPPGREAKNLPLVVMPHGGPHNYDTTGFDWWSQAFASRGYAGFQPNFRGSTTRNLAFQRASDGEWGGKMQTDITDGVDALAKQGIVDPSRACIVGASYGGYAALAGVTIEQGRYRCAVAVAPVTDLFLMVDNDMRRTNRNRMLKRSLAQELGPRSNFDARSPRRQAAKADAPILLIHGRDDTVVDILQSEKMADALKDAGKPHEFIVLDGEDHWLSRAETRKAMLDASVGFVTDHNPPD